MTAFLNSAAQGNMLEPHGLANGSLVAQWPLFTWFVGLIALIPINAEFLWPMVSSIGAMLALVAAWFLAHASRFGAKAAFAAGLILLCAPIFAPLGHFVGKSALTAALIIFALACFTRGWLSNRAWISLPLAFLFTCLAGLSGGIYAFALPLIASFFFLIWRANLGRSSRADAIFGFGLLLALLGVWLGLVILKGTDATYLNTLFANAWQSPWPLPAGWWLAGLIAVAGLFPWILLVICVSWARVMKTSVSCFPGCDPYLGHNNSLSAWCSAWQGLCQPSGFWQPLFLPAQRNLPDCRRPVHPRSWLWLHPALDAGHAAHNASDRSCALAARNGRDLDNRRQLRAWRSFNAEILQAQSPGRRPDFLRCAFHCPGPARCFDDGSRTGHKKLQPPAES